MAEIVILSYHNIEFEDKHAPNLKKDYYTISLERFNKHLEIIERNEIQILTPNDLTKDFSSKKTGILFTFDDGHASHFHLSQEVLNERNISGLFFPITSEINQKGKMTKKHLQILLEKGNEIGSHGHTHKNFKNLKKDEIIEEITTSMSILEQITGKSTNFLAFPFGVYSDESKKTALENGVKKCFTTDGSPNPTLNDFLLHRININRSISDSDFERIITGDKSYYRKRIRQLKFQTVLRSLLGRKAETRIKEIYKRA